MDTCVTRHCGGNEEEEKNIPTPNPSPLRKEGLLSAVLLPSPLEWEKGWG
jgi:hypothetical protein